MLAVSVLLMQAALPSPDTHYYARTYYVGPGLVCGAAFSIRLVEGETAILTKRSAIDGEFDLRTRDGQFAIHESQYATSGGTFVRNVADGVLERKYDKGRYIWIYRDQAPGSTDVFGPNVNTPAPSPALNRISFGGPRYGFVGQEKCMEGIESGER